MLELSAKNFQVEVLDEGEKAVLVDFWAPWCGPCRMQTPVLEQFEKQYGGFIKVAKCNIDDNEKLAAQYGVMSIPTLVVFKSGEPATRAVGVQNLDALKKLTGI